MSKRPPDSVIAAYVRARLAEKVQRDGLTHAQLALLIGVTRGRISQVLGTGTESLGYKFLRGASDVLEMSVEQIEEAAGQWRQDHPDEPLPTEERVIRIERDERYPNRALAAEVARRSGISDEAISAVCSWNLKSAEDPAPMDWLEDMRGEDRRLKRNRLTPGSEKKALDENEARNRAFVEQETNAPSLTERAAALRRKPTAVGPRGHGRRPLKGKKPGDKGT